MKKIIYYVAVSLDGYIAGPHQDVTKFAHDGPMVDAYTSDLTDFRTVIMGSKTYEFGFQYGLKPGFPAYPNMEHFVFSGRALFEPAHPDVHLMSMDAQHLKDIKAKADSDIYLCGGGEFASWVAHEKALDEIHLKVNPIVLGGGTKLFSRVPSNMSLHHKATIAFEGGYSIQSFDVQYT